jgi:CHAT domain-containing protein/tetratricopeptide (TPR) repeat protein
MKLKINTVPREQKVHEQHTLTLGRRYFRIVLLTLLVVLSLPNTAVPKDTPADEAHALYSQASKLEDDGKYAEAIPVAEHALSIRQQWLGPKHRDTGSSLDLLGILHHRLNHYDKAGRLYQEALQVREAVLGLDHAETLGTLNNLALLYRDRGDYEDAESIFRRVISVREKLPDHENAALGRAYSNLGRLLYLMGKYVDAEPFYLQSIAIKERTLSPEHPSAAISHSGLALVYKATGSFDKAVKSAQRALEIAEKALGSEHPLVMPPLEHLASIYIEMGEHQQAEPLVQRALALHEKSNGPNDPDIGALLDELGQIVYHVKFFSEQAGTEAIGLFERAITIYEKTLGTETVQLANILNNIGTIYFDRHAYREAEQFYIRALTIDEKTLGSKHPSTLDCVLNLAILNWARGDSDKAFTLFQRAQASQTRNGDRFLLTGSESRKAAYLQTLVDDTSRNVSFSVSVPGPNAIALGLTAVLKHKGRALDATSGSIARLRQSLDPQDQLLFKQLANVTNQLSTSVHQDLDRVPVEEFRKRLTELSSQQERLENELALRSREFRRQIAPITIAGVRRAIPADAAVVEWIRYISFDPTANSATRMSAKPRYAAYVLKRSLEPAVIDVGDAETIDATVQDFRQAVSQFNRDTVEEHARALSDKVFKPLSRYLKGTKHLFVSPDGALNLVPMAALMDEEGSYLARLFDISYLTNGRDLLRVDQNPVQRNNVIVVADPAFGPPSNVMALADPNAILQRSLELDRGGFIFRSLTETAIEAQEIGKLLKLDRTNVWLREEATEFRLKQIRRPRILHIASHGFFLSDQYLSGKLRKHPGPIQTGTKESPMIRSGLALSGANQRHSGEGNDGIVTALELAQLDLLGTELVVLSACDSGIGDIQNSEGVYGLRRALVLAGAQTQVTSLWKVSDEATRTLMVNYYRRLLKGEGRSGALRQAQLDMLADPSFSQPYYWASFIPIGNWKPLPALH